MEFQARFNTKFQQYVLSHLEESFCLIDVGCAGGIDKFWNYTFKDKLVAHGFDSNISAIDALKKQHDDNVRYVCAKVKTTSQEAIQVHHKNLWSRTSAALAQTSLQKKIDTLSVSEIIDNNCYSYTKSAENEVSLSDYIQGHCNNVDFIKIDVDGPDMDILKSIEKELKSKEVLGVVIEINYEGLENRFSRVDEFLNNLGYECCDITKRTYDSAALPGKFIYNITAQTFTGRIVQGDALYLRDPCKDALMRKKTLSTQKLLKLLILYDMFNMSSWAAEILSRLREDFTLANFNIDEALDLLAQDMYKFNEFKFLEHDHRQVNYKTYLQCFENDYTKFFSNKLAKRVTNFVKKFLDKVR